jgi:hypothetical protein
MAFAVVAPAMMTLAMLTFGVLTFGMLAAPRLGLFARHGGLRYNIGVWLIYRGMLEFGI